MIRFVSLLVFKIKTCHDDPHWKLLLEHEVNESFVLLKVMDKYGEFYGHDRISELLGMDKAALDFSDAHKKRKPRRDSSLAAV